MKTLGNNFAISKRGFHTWLRGTSTAVGCDEPMIECNAQLQTFSMSVTMPE